MSRSSASRTSAGTVGNAGLPGRAPAALAGDQLVPAGLPRPHDDRLHEPLRANRVGQRARRLVVEALPRLARVRVDRLDGKVRQLRLTRAADEHLQAAAEAAASSQERPTSSIATFQYASAPADVRS